MNLDKEPALREAMTYIKLHPEEWDQTTYVCRTGGCLAGTAIALHLDRTFRQLSTSRDCYGLSYFSYGAELLGFTYDEATRIFKATSYCPTHDKMYILGSPECFDGCRTRHPTYQEFENHVSEVTGLKFKDGEEL